MKLLCTVVILLSSFNVGLSQQFQFDSLFVQINGDTVNIWDIRVEENCASRFRSALNVVNDTVTWVQTDTIGPLLTCVCLFNLRASLTGLSPSTDRVMVYRERRMQYGYPRDTMMFIGSLSFDVVSSGGSFSANCYRNGCNLVSVSEPGSDRAPSTYTLENYPNPFNPATTIAYTLPARSHVRLELYDVLGRLVTVLVDEERTIGTHKVAWRANVASGVYHCRLIAASLSGTVVQSRKLVLLR